jgi:hypothetical protein
MKIFLLSWIVLLAVIFLLVKLVDKSPEAPSVDYGAALELTSSAAVAWPERGGVVEQEGFARFKEFWRDLSEERVKEWLPQVYAENVWFNDTVKTITNRAELLDYMLHTASMVKSTSVEVKDIAATDEGYYVRWVMTVEPANPRYGDQWVSIGMTHIRLNANGQVILHQDYWDAAGGLYEHFPVLGWMIRNIKARL